MLKEEDLDKLSVMCELTKTMIEACKEGLVNRSIAESHVMMYVGEITTIIHGEEKKAEHTA